MLVVKFVPTFNDNSMLQTAEDVAWQLRGNVVDGEVYVCIDSLLMKEDKTVEIYRHQVIKHLMLQLHLFGVGVEGCDSINYDFSGWGDGFLPLQDQLEEVYYWDKKHGLVCSKRYQKLNGFVNPSVKKSYEEIMFSYLKKHVLYKHTNMLERQEAERKQAEFNKLNPSSIWVL